MSNWLLRGRMDWYHLASFFLDKITPYMVILVNKEIIPSELEISKRIWNNEFVLMVALINFTNFFKKIKNGTGPI